MKKLAAILLVVNIIHAQDCTSEEVAIWGLCYSIENTTILQNNDNTSGEIPEVICDLINLETLDLSVMWAETNYVTSEIPECIGTLENLTYLNYSEINGANPFDPSSFDASNKRNTGYFRMENSIPTVAEIGRTHCNIVNTYATKQKQKRTSQKVHCYSRWGTGTNDYEETIIDNPF